jgi:hypothetical protein
MDSYGKALSLKSLLGQQQMQDMQMQQAQEQQRYDRDYGDALKNSVGPDGKLNTGMALASLAKSGNTKGYGALLKQQQDQQKSEVDLANTRSQTGERDYGVLKKKLGAVRDVLGSMLSRPDVTHDDVVQGLVQLKNTGAIDDQQALAALQSIPGDPTKLRPFLIQRALENMEASKRLEAVMPQRKQVNNGKVTLFPDMNEITTPGGPAPIQMTTTPGEDQSAATSRRGQNMADARAREGNDIARQAARTQVVETPDGYALVDKGTGLVRPAATMSGAQIKGKDSGLNDSQAKALLFGSRMQASNKILDALSSQGVDQPGMFKRAVTSVPWIGDGLGTMANGTQSTQQQQVEQAQRDFINAVLRRESGAAIAPSEFDSATKQYFPQPGDSGAVKQQKAMNRKLAIRGLMAEVPANKAAQLNTQEQQSTQKPAALPGGWSVTEH